MMHTKPDLRVRISNEVTRSGSVITDVIWLNHSNAFLTVIRTDCDFRSCHGDRIYFASPQTATVLRGAIRRRFDLMGKGGGAFFVPVSRK